MLTADEIRRYQRHIVLKNVGGPGQQKLKAAKVLIIGAGGLGSPVIAYLAAAGVGTIGVVDDDIVSLSNLQRQMVHRTQDEGVTKVDSAKRFANALNPNVNFIAINQRLNENNGAHIIAPYDFVVDGSDNFDTRALVAEFCAEAKIPLVAGAVSLFDGNLTVFAPFKDHNPRFSDLYPQRPTPDQLPSCEEAGILGPITAVIGGLQAMEVVKLITGVGEPLVGRLLTYDGRDARFREMRYRRAP
ncbi:HesA/MoeB/ThiF family protein [Maritalea porphyrae]|uniref:HesA/MoeB/ThiF family protein n=1 Tax=Maritalea porphyrae TaxID=880732 RepID=UPI0022B06E1C|nr:molybdopterin-synthase adenylyltransferase MoeB [Maritalea porphyrae]MCZ4272163.1 molybdopterin-synthase adenylyltransferase MoeB [Maritalea porphyrae]